VTPEDFKDIWRYNTRTEKSAAQEHFLNLCEVLGVEKPSKVDPKGDWFTFERHVTKDDGHAGYVDVWRKDCFAWEYKRSLESGQMNHKNLVKAHAQVKSYAGALGNPPLLIVSDMKEIRITTNFTNSIVETHVIDLGLITDPKKRQLLTWCFTDPERLRPDITREVVTTKAAMALGVIANRLRNSKHKYDPRRVAHFLNKIVFCLFAEDIDLLPNEVFADILEECKRDADEFPAMLGDLFRAMKDKDGRFGMLKIPWFNGGLFDDDDVLPLGFLEISDLAQIALLDWSAIEPAIFGTLFESGLNPDKRKQMAGLFDAYGVEEAKPTALPGILDNPIADKGVGIHYTDPDTIMKIIDPVVLAPLRREWTELKDAIATQRAKKAKAKSDAARTKAENAARKIYREFRTKLGAYRVLDPACGGGNFLYLTLQKLKDFDLLVLREAEEMDLPRDEQCVGPEAVLGIEINPYAAELARVTIWIGELQWQMNNNFAITRMPILGSLNGIQNRDALINPDGSEAKWPNATAVVGNPPFLGDKKMVPQLGEEYTLRLRKLFDSRVPGGADFVTYWFEKARAHMESDHLTRAGLVTTNSIRGGANQKVLKRILDSGTIFDAWSDEPWVLDGAAVRVSLISFGAKSDSETFGYALDGKESGEIFADLKAAMLIGGGPDLTKASRLQGMNIAFIGTQKNGPFDIPGDLAREWIDQPLNPNGSPNSDVIKPWVNGQDITRRRTDTWVIDFGTTTEEANASLYEIPFEYVKKYVKPKRDGLRRQGHREYWWRHGEARPGMRKALDGMERFICTPRVSKHRVFVWLDKAVLPDSATVAIARDDDTTFGILHSRFHELWSLRMCTFLGVGNDPRYTPSTTFETFPFPAGLTPNIAAVDYADDPRAQAIAEAARALNELRENWLNPSDLVKREPEVVEGCPERILPVNAKAAKELKKRTLTNLYNARPAWLEHAHKTLDDAVAAAYGWPADLSDDAVLERLFNLNQDRAAAENAD